MAPWLGWHKALFAAGVATGPLSAGLLGAGLAFAAAPVSERGWLWVAPVIGPLVPGIRGFASFGVIHYHIAQLALVAITAGFALRAKDGGASAAWGAGIAGGFALWMMPETMPFVLLGYGALGYVWLFRPIGGAIARFVIFQQYPAGFAAGLLPVALSDASARLAARPQRAAFVRIGAIASILLLPYGPALALAAAKPGSRAKPPSCAMRHIAPLLAPAAGVIVLFCPGGPHDPLGRHGPKGSLWSMLSAGRTPPWLTLVGQEQKSGFRLYRVVPAESG